MSDTPASLDRPWHRHTLRAPHDDEAVLAVPPLADAAELARRNAELLRGADLDIQGQPLSQLRDWARREVCRAAREYTATWCDDVSSVAAPELLFVGGHQPTLFHPGVWVKNFAVGRLARDERAVGLNLVVDNDTLSTSAIRMPSGNRDAPNVELIPFDDPRPSQPWEDARIFNRDLFDSFAKRVERGMARWGIAPLVAELWPAAVRHAERSNLLVDCFTAARNQCERKWGTSNLELPLSRMCRLDSFLWFVAHLLAHLPRFHGIYNDVVHEYRVLNKVRSKNHPVPDLRATDGWLESPFWVWRDGAHQRQRLLARHSGAEVWLSDGMEVFAKLPLSGDGDAGAAVNMLRQLPAQGIHLRTRALTTTLFARLCLADLFVHGIGGAKYDEMTDRIIGRFFGISAPGFLALTATLRLPLGSHPVESADEQRLRGILRELEFNSDRHFSKPPDASVSGLVDEKHRLIADQQTIRRLREITQKPDHNNHSAPRNGYKRFRRLQELNRDLAAATAAERRRVEEELHRTVRQLAANDVLRSREYAYCLFPADKLRHFLESAVTTS